MAQLTLAQLNIIERQCSAFCLASVRETYNFATFMLWLKLVWTPRLQELVELNKSRLQDLKNQVQVPARVPNPQQLNGEYTWSASLQRPPKVIPVRS